MIRAKARKASLASPDVGNAAATSGSSTTTALPAEYLDADPFGSARLKSYSGRISLGPVRAVVTLALRRALFIVPSLTMSGAPRADDPNGFAALDVHHRDQSSRLRQP